MTISEREKVWGREVNFLTVECPFSSNGNFLCNSTRKRPLKAACSSPTTSCELELWSPIVSHGSPFLCWADRSDWRMEASRCWASVPASSERLRSPVSSPRSQVVHGTGSACVGLILGTGQVSVISDSGLRRTDSLEWTSHPLMASCGPDFTHGPEQPGLDVDPLPFSGHKRSAIIFLLLFHSPSVPSPVRSRKCKSLN